MEGTCINSGVQITESNIAFAVINIGIIVQGRDQRDYYYFMGLGHYKLEVSTLGHY